MQWQLRAGSMHLGSCQVPLSALLQAQLSLWMSGPEADGSPSELPEPLTLQVPPVAAAWQAAVPQPLLMPGAWTAANTSLFSSISCTRQQPGRHRARISA